MIYGERHKPVEEGSKVWLKAAARRPQRLGIGLVAQRRIKAMGVSQYAPTRAEISGGKLHG